MTFRIRGLDPAPFRHLFGLSDRDLAAHNARRVVAGAHPGYPDRVTLADAEPGRALLLVNHVHQPAATPYRASHAVFVLEGAETPTVFTDEVPDAIRRRPISLRAFDAGHDMVDADLVDGANLAQLIARMFADPAVAYLHAHYAGRGCFAALVERA